MKLCKDCKHASDIYCKSPKRERKVYPATGESLARLHTSFARYQPALCGWDGNWFEPKQLDPGEGWRLLEDGETIQENDEFLLSNGQWIKTGRYTERYWSNGSTLLPHRRRITPALAKCPEGHKMEVVEFTDGEWVADCSDRNCYWRGGPKKTEHEAAGAWNAVMAKIQVGKDAVTKPV